VLLVRAAHANRSAADSVLIAVTLPHSKLLAKIGRAGFPLHSSHTSGAGQQKLFRIFVLCSRSLAFYRHLKRPTQHVVVGNCVLSDQH
jgi:hypothetical protein